MTIVESGWILERATKKLAAADVRNPIDQQALDEWEGRWVPESLKLALALIAAQSPKQQSLHWDWRQKLNVLGGLLAYPSYSLSSQGSLEGMMIVKLDQPARLAASAGKSLVYIDYLESAPWNLKTAVSTPKYKGVGALLVGVAARRSVSEECEGRVGLHSLPQSETFYSKIGMTDLGLDPKHQNLRYFEFAPEAARTFLKGGEK